jgi:hypothetical protein
VDTNISADPDIILSRFQQSGVLESHWQKSNRRIPGEKHLTPRAGMSHICKVAMARVSSAWSGGHDCHNVLPCHVMARKPKDITPRFGIGEWFGFNLTQLSGEALMASVRGSVMLTYDDAPKVRSMAERHGFRIEPVLMKNTHHELIRELLILKP